ncbi:TRAP transporter small permease [Notoacmeibacter ruber]|uniref:TRAP transporter small permease protein n=1 Tax=Notoacmeibacter ruber TaxID=2670375 RepID=A0A3L7JKX5_9HYPH|nr:TRAP transporter small permease subunit [Notoacmeibacter ruber]RLQ89172.1 TRAP transporter small permease subunit [Notoacmeibacter ruber]
MRQALDRLYNFSGALAAASLCLICILVCIQVFFNLLTRTGLFGINLTVPSYADFAGYLLAAASFLALAYTLTRGGHIRVTLLTGLMGRRTSLAFEILALAFCAACAAAASWYVALLAHESWEFGDVSSGIVVIPLFIPQLAVLGGLVIFTIALVDLLARTVRTGRTVIEDNSSE